MPNIEALVAIVLIGTQVVKAGLIKLGLNIQGVFSIVLAALVSLAVVAFNAIQFGVQFNLDLFWLFVQVAFFAAGGKAFLRVLFPKKNGNGF